MFFDGIFNVYVKIYIFECLMIYIFKFGGFEVLKVCLDEEYIDKNWVMFNLFLFV